MTLGRLVHRLANALGLDRHDEDLARENAAHTALLEDDFRRRGLPAADARIAARRALGSAALAMDRHRDARSFVWLDDLRRDVRYAVRALGRAPGFAALAILTLALGIGATSAIFTLINDVMLRPLPVRDARALVVLGDTRGSGTAIGRQGGSFTLFSYDLYQRLLAARVFDGLCAVQSSKSRVSVRRPGAPVDDGAYARFVSTNYFDVLGTGAALGRLLAPADDDPAAPAAAVVSFRYWADRLHRDPSIVGSTLTIDRVPLAIVGVAAPEFYGETLEADPPSMWIALRAERQLEPSRRLIDAPDIHWLYLVGRAGPASTGTQAQARVTMVLQQWLREREGTAMSADTAAKIASTRVELRPGASGVAHARREYSSALQLLLGISSLVLLIACANLANLLLARGAAREHETAIRRAIGASRGRLLRQSLAESLTLAIAGGAAGLLVASWAVEALLALVFRGAAYVPFSTTPDARVLAFTIALSCAAAAAFGLLPAIRGTSIGSTRHTGVTRWGGALVVAQVALSLVVIAAAGALARSLANLAAQPFGFEREHVLVVDVDASRAGYTSDRLPPVYRELQTRLAALPGVSRAALAYYSPFDGCCWSFTIAMPDAVRNDDERRSAMLNRVSDGYFETLGTRVVRGRTFDDRDRGGAPRVAVVNTAFVRRFVGRADPIGRRFSVGDGGVPGAIEIVGVVENAKYDDPHDDTAPMAFLPLLQTLTDDDDADTAQSKFIRTIALRTTGDPAALASSVRHTLVAIDPDLPILGIDTLSSQVGRALNGDSVVATLAGLFGLVALILTCVGLYGLTAYGVERRTREIGIRVALGAQRSTVVTMVIREVLARAAIGTVAGVPAAFVAMRVIRSALYGVSPADPRDASAAAAVLLACMLAAGYAPARRASRIEPVDALRRE
jgi:macrolide transport system ATP-binding/permease protein